MRILVVGAGIAGLAAGRALTRAGHAVEVVERAAVPVGPGRVYCYADATDAGPGQIKELFAGFADPAPAALDRLADPYVGWIEEAPPARFRRRPRRTARPGS